MIYLLDLAYFKFMSGEPNTLNVKGRITLSTIHSGHIILGTVRA